MIHNKQKYKIYSSKLDELPNLDEQIPFAESPTSG